MTDAGGPHKGDEGSGSGAGPDAVSQVEDGAKSIARLEPRIRAFRDLHLAAARQEARRLDGLPPAERGPLHGLPTAVKEVFDVAGMRCEWGTPIHARRVPGQDCKLVRDLKAAGAVIVGTTAATEYAMAREAPTVNPFDPDRTPGASSSGSGAAVGGGMVPCALGSQTIGSGIRPAAYCGVIGFKASMGALSNEGGMPLSEHLDHPAILASGFDVLEPVFNVLASGAQTQPRVAPSDDCPIVVVAPWYDDPVDASVDAAVDAAAALFAEMGHAVERRELGALAADEAQCHATILSHDMARNHRADYHRAGDRMSGFLRGWIEAGQRVGKADYAAALARRAEIIAGLEAWLPESGVILTAAATGPAPLRAEGTGSRAPQRLWTLAGFPALTVPGWWAGHLPVGVQLVARRGADRGLLAVGRRLFEAVHGARADQPRPKEAN